MNELRDPIAELEELMARADAILAQHRRPVAVYAESPLASLELDAWGLVHNVSVARPFPPLWELDAELDRLLDLAALALNGVASQVPTGVTLTPSFDPARPAPTPLERLVNGGTYAEELPASVDRSLERVEGRGRAGGAYAVVYPGGAVMSLSLTDEEDPDEVGDLMLEALINATDDAGRQVEMLVRERILDPDWALTKMLLSNPYKENAHA